MCKRMVWLFGIIVLPIFSLSVWTSELHGGRETAVSAANPGNVIISEVAWGGTTANASDEWIELFNNTTSPIDLTNWTLNDANAGINIILNGIIPSQGFFLFRADR